MEIEKKIQNIPQKVTEKRTVTSTVHVFFGLFRRTSRKLVDVEVRHISYHMGSIHLGRHDYVKGSFGYKGYG
jgi:hypothetical protein